MRVGNIWRALAAGFTVIACLAGPTTAAPALVGQVHSAEEGQMEGVIVSLRLNGSPITISVISDDAGRFRFPAERLKAGRYSVSIRAPGYILSSPETVAIPAVNDLDLSLRRTAVVATDITAADWLRSMDGTDQQKRILLNCNACHTYDRILNSRYTAEQFIDVIHRMTGYAMGSTPQRPQLTAGRRVPSAADLTSVSQWLAENNLSQGPHKYTPVPLPRVKGRATGVIITEYDLPRREAMPHDVVVDRSGTAWYVDFGQQMLGALDPKTGNIVEYEIPIAKQGFATGSLELELGSNNDIWIGMQYQGAIARFDLGTHAFAVWPAPQQGDATQLGFIQPQHSEINNQVWVKNSDRSHILQFDMEKKTFSDLGDFRNPTTGQPLQIYGILSDSKNNLYMLDFCERCGGVGAIDAKSHDFRYYSTPTPASRPRRGSVDNQDRLWLAEFAGDAIGMFDPKTQSIQEWKLPTKWTSPYDVMLDRGGDAWIATMMTDRINRLNPRTGEITEYPLPRPTNMRRIFVQNTPSTPVIWVGSNHGASIVKLEPLN